MTKLRLVQEKSSYREKKGLYETHPKRISHYTS